MPLTTDICADMPRELAVASEKYAARQQRTLDILGLGQTDAGLAVINEYLGSLVETVRTRLEPSVENNRGTVRDLSRLLRGLSPEVISLALLTSALHSVAHGHLMRQALMVAGNYLASEAWAAGLLNHNPGLARRIEKAVRKKHGALRYRTQAARSVAKKVMPAFKERLWSNPERLKAGGWGIGLVLEALPDVFLFEKPANSREEIFTISQEAWSVAENAIAQAVLKRPMYFPSVTPVPPWTGWAQGGTNDPRLARHLTVVRSPLKETQRAVDAAIRNGTMKPALDAINTLQAVPWKINKRVLGVMRECIAQGIEVPGLPPHAPLDHLAIDAWEDLTDLERKRWRYQAEKVKIANLGFIGCRALLKEDMCTAEALAQHDRFWTPMNFDWRGRVYGVPTFNFQRDDRVRSLFLFADGEPIGEEGLYWLKVHVANCGDFDKTSKKPFAERIKWVDDNLERIEEMTCMPLTKLWWACADKPFLFLAACLELVSAKCSGPSFVTTLPVSFDGSCSGLQHLCAMTRAPEGSLVNLTPQDKPQDVYQLVADRVAAAVEADETKPDLAKLWADYGISRSVVKRNVMTYAYSSKVFGMAEQHREDLMKPLAADVLMGKLSEHPFGEDEGARASIYLAQHVYGQIETVVPRPAAAMGFLQKIAEALADVGKPVRWTSPAGIPWINRYYELDCERITLWMHDRSVQLKVAVGNKPKINKRKAISAVAPNFVHACDAAHLLRVTNAAAAEGIIALATVHDSFGCLASRAGRFRKLIREEFVRMYQEHDPLEEVLLASEKQLGAKLDLTTPVRGELDIEDVLSAEFAFA